MSKNWRKVNINPIFKKGKKENQRSYKLVSLTSTPEKLVEHLILDTMSRHMKDKKVIINSSLTHTSYLALILCSTNTRDRM